MTRLIIDGDIPLYQESFSCEEVVDWGDDLWTLHADLKTGISKFEGWYKKLQFYLDIPEVIFCFTDSSANFRKDVLPEYKASRAKKRKPVIYAPLKDYISEKYESIQVKGLEADDLLGLLAEPTDIMVSSDKDLLTVPGLHFNPTRTERGTTQVSRYAGDYNHMRQTLSGDLVDGYKGCPGVGAKTALKLLNGVEYSPVDMWDTVLKAYTKAGKTEEEALAQARVAYICRPGDWDWDLKEVKLWQPPQV